MTESCCLQALWPVCHFNYSWQADSIAINIHLTPSHHKISRPASLGSPTLYWADKQMLKVIFQKYWCYINWDTAHFFLFRHEPQIFTKELHVLEKHLFLWGVFLHLAVRGIIPQESLFHQWTTQACGGPNKHLAEFLLFCDFKETDSPFLPASSLLTYLLLAYIFA